MTAAGNLITVQVKPSFRLPFTRTQLKNIIGLVLKTECPRREWEVECLITDDASIRRLNGKYRNKHEPTDVLSFTLTDRGGSDPAIKFPSVPGIRTNLGQVIISYETAARQAAQRSAAIGSEIKLLLIHGTLHLTGMDHQKPADARKMQAKERKYINLIDKVK